MSKYLHDQFHRLFSQVQITDDISQGHNQNFLQHQEAASASAWTWKSSLNVLLGIQCPPLSKAGQDTHSSSPSDPQRSVGCDPLPFSSSGKVRRERRTGDSICTGARARSSPPRRMGQFPCRTHTHTLRLVRTLHCHNYQFTLIQ